MALFFNFVKILYRSSTCGLSDSEHIAICQYISKILNLRELNNLGPCSMIKTKIFDQSEKSLFYKIFGKKKLPRAHIYNILSYKEQTTIQ